ncbi:hypothetical protein [Parasphingorhabdus sp.]
MTFTAQILTLYPEMFPGPMGASLSAGVIDTWIKPAIVQADFVE